MEDKRCMERRFTIFDKVEYVIIYMCIVLSIDYKNITHETPTKMTNKRKTDTQTINLNNGDVRPGRCGGPEGHKM